MPRRPDKTSPRASHSHSLAPTEQNGTRKMGRSPSNRLFQTASKMGLSPSNNNFSTGR